MEKYLLRLNATGNYYIFSYEYYAAYRDGRFVIAATDNEALIEIICIRDNQAISDPYVREHYDIYSMQELTSQENRLILQECIENDNNETYFERVIFQGEI